MPVILMIDDDPLMLEDVDAYITENVPHTTFHKEENFANGVARVLSVRPDIVILDVFEGNQANGNVAAQPVWSELWTNWFCPLIFYSAGDADVEPAPPDDHPFVRVVHKGSSSKDNLIAEINAFIPHVNAVRSVEAELSKVAQSVLRDVAKHVFSVETEELKRQELLVRTARRRVAAKMDDCMAVTGEPLHPWEQYIHPPLSLHLALGDILRLTDGTQSDPTAYRVVLTPTCDLVPQGKQSKCKVDAVLAVKACEPSDFITKGLNISQGTAEKTVKKNIARALNDAQQLGMSVLAEYPGVIPLLALNFRNLELIPLDDIAPDRSSKKRLTRVASIDSPFRESIAWAFLQINCRPGIPPRNMESVTTALLQAFNPTPPTTGQ